MAINDYLEFAQETALRAGQLLCNMAGNFGTIKYKSNDGDLVTEADKACEKFIIKQIRNSFGESQFSIRITNFEYYKNAQGEVSFLGIFPYYFYGPK